jgi:hypothetical protein
VGWIFTNQPSAIRIGPCRILWSSSRVHSSTIPNQIDSGCPYLGAVKPAERLPSILLRSLEADTKYALEAPREKPFLTILLPPHHMVMIQRFETDNHKELRAALFSPPERATQELKVRNILTLLNEHYTHRKAGCKALCMSVIRVGLRLLGFETPGDDGVVKVG